MATANQARNMFARNWPRAVALLALILGLLWWFQGEAIAGQAEAGTAYAAKSVCSCRHLGGRDMAQCKGGLLPGMGAVFLSEDADEKSVTATVPLIASTRATFREGYGCVLEPWEG